MELLAVQSELADNLNFFVRTKQQVNGKVSILIVENVREFGKVCQKTLRRVVTILPNEAKRLGAIR